MVSKQNKYLRQQAVLRAERYTDEQNQKRATKTSAEDTIGIFVHEISLWTVANKQMGSAELVALPDAPTAKAKISHNTGRQSTPTGKATAARSKNKDALLVNEDNTLKRASASSKEGFNAVLSVPCDDPNLSQKLADGRSSLLLPSISYSIAGGIRPEAIDLPASSPPLTPMRSSRPTPNQDASQETWEHENASSPITLNSLKRLRHGGPTKEPLLQPVPDYSFTFRSEASLSSRKNRNSQLAFQDVVQPAIPISRALKIGSARTVESSRSIFDVLEQRSKPATDSSASNAEILSATTNKVYGSNAGHVSEVFQASRQDVPPTRTERTKVVCNNNKTVRCVSLCGAPDLTFSKLAIWAEVEIKRLQQAEAVFYQDQQDCHLSESTTRRSMELVLYAPVTSNIQMLEEVPVTAITRKLEVIPKQKILRTAIPAKTWQENRIFFAAIDGDTRLVDFTRTMYDVEVMVDDGGSDFDSIASPAKFELPLNTMGEDTEPTSSSDEAEYGIDIEDLAELHYLDCNVVTCDREKTSDRITSWNFLDDDDVIDHHLVFSKRNLFASADTTANTGADDLDVVDLGQARNTLLQKDKSDLSTATTIESRKNNSFKQATRNNFRHIPSSLNVELFSDIPIGYQEYDGSEAHSGRVYEFEETLVNTELSSPTDTTYVASSDRSGRVSDDCSEGMEHLASPQPFRSDWASELTRMTLGTESLFTFLDHLSTDDEESSTKSALVTAFLELVNLERTKLGEHSLPHSYTASSVMASKIIPHTIFLGTTSLASFLSHFTFGKDSKTTIEEMYRVFTVLCKEDLRLQNKVISGIMGALGWRLGKLPFAA